MTINESNTLESRVIAPKLRRLRDHAWAWVALGDLTEIFNQNVTCIWWHYCNDARAAALAEDWDGKPWKFALPSGAGHEIKNVWDMKTGDLTQVSDDLIANVLVPAGWSKTKVQVADQLEKALRRTFTLINERWTSARETANVTGPATTAEMLSEVESAIQAIGTFSTLDLVLSQIESGPGGLSIRRRDEDETSNIRLSFRDPRRVHNYGLSLEMQIRTVLGSLKMHEFASWVHGMY